MGIDRKCITPKQPVLNTLLSLWSGSACGLYIAIITQHSGAKPALVWLIAGHFLVNIQYLDDHLTVTFPLVPATWRLRNKCLRRACGWKLLQSKQCWNGILKSFGFLNNHHMQLTSVTIMNNYYEMFFSAITCTLKMLNGNSKKWYLIKKKQ